MDLPEPCREGSMDTQAHRRGSWLVGWVCGSVCGVWRLGGKRARGEMVVWVFDVWRGKRAHRHTRRVGGRLMLKGGNGDGSPITTTRPCLSQSPLGGRRSEQGPPRVARVALLSLSRRSK